MRKLLIEHDHICMTAAQEVARAEVFDALPTNVQAAYHELDRLVALYETRYVEDFQTMITPTTTSSSSGEKDNAMKCNICQKTMKDDYDICDYCTWIDGRKAVQKVILDRIGGHLAYMEAHTSESETASRIITSHSMKITGRSYDTTKHLFDFSLEVKDLRAVVKAEVRQTRITRTIEALRLELTQGREFSRTAYLESLVTENFTMEELKRLRLLKEWYDDLRSVSKRCLQPVGCPLGHYAIPYEQTPPQYETPTGTGPPPSLSTEIVINSASLGGSKKIDKMGGSSLFVRLSIVRKVIV
eukprot:scaffold549_cov174-Ochromonas_danica.AAC.18